MKHARALGGLSIALAAIACGGEAATGSGAAAPGQDQPREPVTAEVMRSKWEGLATEEVEIVKALDEMGGLPPDARMSRLQRARDGAGFVAGGLTSFAPPSDLKACHEKGLEGARELRAALDGIHAMWLGRSAGDRRAESQRLAEGICIGAGKLAAARSACGVTARVGVPLACAAAPRP